MWTRRLTKAPEELHERLMIIGTNVLGRHMWDIPVIDYTEDFLRVSECPIHTFLPSDVNLLYRKVLRLK